MNNEEQKDSTNRAYILSSIVCDRIWGGEHGWETATEEQFNSLCKKLREKLREID